MSQNNLLQESFSTPSGNRLVRSFWEKMHIDMPLFIGLALVLAAGGLILFSADNQSLVLIIRQAIWVVLAVAAMFLFAQIPPERYQQWTPVIFLIGLALLGAVLVIGHSGKGAQRWLGFGSFHFQPSEIMKLAMPMMLAWLLDKTSLPPKLWVLLICAVLLVVPVGLTAKQPDLGTALIIMFTGVCVLLLAGIRWRYVIILVLMIAASAPFLWHFLHDYQRQRVLTFLDPERDPLGTGYHIIQSKIAIGSGGIFGKGYLQGTQSHLQFLPEHATDFIFGVCGEEFGLIGSVLLILLMTFVALRGLYISTQAQDTFSRLLAGSLSLTFFLSCFVNMGMVTGLLPVVGVPLPLISYGGSAMITIMIGFGIIMSIHTHRKLLGR
ncbi:MAG TPA: rod shape-determining protein RodA [Gammaproteobacteria bacterium]|nr:rod shape-determining protein RodA [Gammaproteobacteria bacterium]